MQQKSTFIPAMRFHWLTPVFDLLAKLTLPDAELKSQLIDQADLQSGYQALDLSCGTATLALLIKQKNPEVAVTGLDIDPKILEIARRKIQEAGVAIELHQGSATQLPYADESYDRVFYSFALHHLNYDDKRRAVAEVFRVLRPGGELHVLDFGKPHTIYCWAVSLVLRWVEELGDNIRGKLPEIFSNTGFQGIEEKSHRATMFGSVSLYKTCKP